MKQGCEGGCCHYLLWEIASKCFDAAPRTSWEVPAGCQGRLAEPADLCSTITYQDSSPTSVAFNDSKMSKCPDKLVHTLTIPREQVCGDDDPDRFTDAVDGFIVAWRVGTKLIGDAGQIALVVNSREQRSQNQLHIHSVRLKPSAREEIESLPVPPRHIDDLSQAWAELQRHADDSGRGDLYGAVVIADPNAPGWIVATVDGTKDPDPTTNEDRNAPEQRFTCWACETCAN